MAEGGTVNPNAFGSLYPPKDAKQHELLNQIKAFAEAGDQGATLSLPIATMSGFHKASAHLYVQVRKRRRLDLLRSTVPADGYERRLHPTGTPDFYIWTVSSDFHTRLLHLTVTSGCYIRLSHLEQGLNHLSWKSHGVDVFVKEAMTQVTQSHSKLVTLKENMSGVQACYTP